MSTFHAELANGAIVKIHTDQPDPYGKQWTAVDDNYDADWQDVSSSPRGWGKTENEAINDLVSQLEEREVA